MTGKLVVVDADELRAIFRAELADALRSAGLGGDDWVTAKTSGLEPRAFKRLAREGAFPTFKQGRRLVARRADVDSWIASRPREVKAEQPADPVSKALATGRLRVVGGRK